MCNYKQAYVTHIMCRLWIYEYITNNIQIHNNHDDIYSQTVLVEHVWGSLAKLESIEFLAESDEAPASMTALVDNLQLHIPMAGLIDKDAELKRLNKAIEKAEKDLQRVSGKLSNENFVSKAPEAVIAKEREKQAEAQELVDQLREQLKKIEAL